MPAPLCRYCGGPIRKRTVSNYVETDPKYMRGPTAFTRHHLVSKDAAPKTKEDCQRMVNEKVVFVCRSCDGKTISRFNTWDGESYESEWFCNGDHAKRFGFLAARSGRLATKAYNEAMEKQKSHEPTVHSNT